MAHGALQGPRALVIDTVMPNFSTEQAQALAMLVLSWRRVEVPAEYVSGAPRRDVPTAEEAETEQRMRTGPGGWFVQTRCFVCHSISAFGVKSPAQIGPDLSTAVEDTQKRFGLTVDDFLQNPIGTMSVVLSRQIILTPAQKETAIQKLREAFAEHQRQQAAGAVSGAEAPAINHHSEGAAMHLGHRSPPGQGSPPSWGWPRPQLLRATRAQGDEARSEARPTSQLPQKTYVAPGDLDEYAFLGRPLRPDLRARRALDAAPLHDSRVHAVSRGGCGFDDESRRKLGNAHRATCRHPAYRKPRATTTGGGSSSTR